MQYIKKTSKSNSLLYSISFTAWWFFESK